MEEGGCELGHHRLLTLIAVFRDHRYRALDQKLRVVGGRAVIAGKSVDVRRETQLCVHPGLSLPKHVERAGRLVKSHLQGIGGRVGGLGNGELAEGAVGVPGGDDHLVVALSDPVQIAGAGQRHRPGGG